MPCPEKFSASLKEYGVDEAVVKDINSGFEGIISSSPKKRKAAYFARAVRILEEKLDTDKMRDILESNACGKSGARDKASKEFARINAGLPLEEKVAKIARAQYMNMVFLK